MNTPFQIASSLARRIYDQEEPLSEKQQAFLSAWEHAKREERETIEAVKRLAHRSLNDAAARALHELESEYDDDVVYLIAEAAE